MKKLFLSAAVVGLLAACSSTPEGTVNATENATTNATATEAPATANASDSVKVDSTKVKKDEAKPAEKK